MNPTLITVGLLMVACAVTLLAHGRRTFLLAVAQGIGIQTIIGACVVAIQIGVLMGDAAPTGAVDRVRLGVQGLPFAASGWTAQQVCQRVDRGEEEPGIDHPDTLVLVAGGQVLLLGLFFGVRRVQEDEGPLDGVQLAVGLLIVINALLGASWAWWA